MTASRGAVAHDAEETERRVGAPRRSPGVIVTVLSLCGVVVALQQTLLLPLIPRLPALLGVSADSASWLVTATLLAGAIATPTIARLADMYGKRRMMLVALSCAVVGSMIGAMSDTLPVLVGSRVLQGVGMALIPVGIAIMRDELPRERVPLGVALMSATLAVGAGMALPLAGLIAEHLDWHAIFWCTGLVGAILLVTAFALLPESPVRTRGTFDLRGAALLSASLTALLLALSKGAHWGLTSPWTVGLALGGALVLIVWVPLELRTPSPLVDLRVAARPAVSLVNAASVLFGFAMFTNMVVTTLQLQMPTATGYGIGLGVLGTGLWMIPIMAAFGLLAPVSAWLTNRFSPQVTVMSGALIMAVAFVGRVFLGDNLGQVVVGSVIVGVGTALAYGALPTLVMRAVPVTETASANGLNVLLRSIGTSTASAAVAAISTASAVVVRGHALPSSAALTTMFWLAAAASLGAVLLAVPMLRIQAYGAESGPAGDETAGPDSAVVHGQVVDPVGRPVRSAVVTVMTAGGEAVDWDQADSEGRFTAAVPEPGAYLVVAAADGWEPLSQILHVEDSRELPPLRLHDRRTLSGTVSDATGEPSRDALVVLTRQSGEAVAATRTNDEGRYEIPRPATGRYVLTVVGQGQTIRARALTILDTGRAIDLTLPGITEQPTTAVPAPRPAAVSASSRQHEPDA